MTQKVIYTEEALSEAVKNSDSVADVMRWFNKRPTGSLHNHISRLIKVYKIDTNHFTFMKNNKLQTKNTRKTAQEILILLTEELSPRVYGNLLTRALREVGVPYKCSGTGCGISDWNNAPITLDVDHIDGNYLNCLQENLRFLCPNCHRQTPTFGRSKESLTEESVKQRTCVCGNTKQRKSKTCTVCYARRKEQFLINQEPNYCSSPNCEKEISIGSKQCSDCYHLSVIGSKRPLTEKIIWPGEEELILLLSQSNYSKVARELKVTDNAVRKRVRSLGYEPKTLKKI